MAGQSLSSAKHSSQVAARYLAVRRHTEQLVAPLSPEDMMVQASQDSSPAKWHLAHTTWFFETFLLSNLPNYREFDQRFRQLFNSYYNAISEQPDRITRGMWSRPSLEEVRAYRAHVDAAMADALERETNFAPDLIELGLNHEQQHQELILTDIKQALYANPLRPAYNSEFALEARPETHPATWIEFPGGVHHIGHTGSGFCFDNELPRHEVLLRPYRISSRLVTNREYLEFVNDDGYSRPELWLSLGWEWLRRTGIRTPLYWLEANQLYTLKGVETINLEAPVSHVSYFEADAFARWRSLQAGGEGTRLPLEAEWEIASLECPELFADYWQWTASPYVAYPGYSSAPGAVGEYNGKFMCNQYVLRGGSLATPAGHIRASYRNFFPPEARWQFSGIRLAQ